jgi:FtsP/CotA-like multicopper oxidase with cupredoxin domain
VNRRRFLQSAACAAVSLADPWSLHAQPVTGASSPLTLGATRRVIDIDGKAANVFGLLQANGERGVRLNAGQPFDVALTNELGGPTLIHWHGLTPPWAMDGVPDTPAALLKAGESRRYAFSSGRGGTHWMHAHTLQEQNLLAAPLIVRTADDVNADEQEVVILLHDFSFTPADELLARLRGPGASGGMSHGGMMRQMMMGGGGMGLDVNDIQYDAYLANDRTLGDPEIVRTERNGRIRLRIINGATATAFTVDTGALPGELIAVDGQPIQAIAGNRFPIVMGQRLDIRVALPKEEGAFPILALREGAPDRTGIILASGGASIAKLPAKGSSAGPIVGLHLESALRARTPLAKRAPDRRYDVTLSGGMQGYDWGILGGDKLHVKTGERIEITMRNMSMMTHPMHLHGHHFQVVALNGQAFNGAVRDTVALPHMAEATIAFDANNPGKWAFHCHHLYHMASGMMAFVTYEGAS